MHLFTSKVNCSALLLPSHGGKDICELPPDGGPCEAYSEQYFYNSTSEACEKFIYGGCDGNKNRFPSIGECERTCTDQSECVFCIARILCPRQEA